MEGPARGVRFIHNGIRTAVARFEAAALDAQDRDEVARLADRLAFLRTVAKTHNDNEEAIIYSALDARLPGLTDSYRLDHQAGERAFADVDQTLAQLGRAEDARERAALAQRLARRAIALNAIIGLYIQKEHEHLVPLQERHFSVEEQPENGTRVIGSFGRELLAKVMPWLLEMQTVDEPDNVHRHTPLR